jgi:hypothetical protein
MVERRRRVHFLKRNKAERSADDTTGNSDAIRGIKPSGGNGVVDQPLDRRSARRGLCVTPNHPRGAVVFLHAADQVARRSGLIAGARGVRESFRSSSSLGTAISR